jgi:hypothetical protein
MLRRRLPLAAAATAAALLPLPAAAYLNPDSGSLLLQALLGGAAGLAVLARLLWGRVAALFRRRPADRAPGEPG